MFRTMITLIHNNQRRTVKGRIAFCILILSVLISTSTRADYSYADSPEFELNLLSFSLDGTYGYADSPPFNLNLYPVNRGWADSNSFSYDGLMDFIPDITGDNKVDEDDLLLLIQQWLQEPEVPSADIAPKPLDNFVNICDFVLIAEHWLEGVE